MNEIGKQFTLEVKNRFAALEKKRQDQADEDLQKEWKEFATVYTEAAENILGKKRTERVDKQWNLETYRQ